MNWLEGLLYGIISGLTEFLPISSQAHQRIFLKFFGMNTPDPLQDLIVHLALLAAVVIGCYHLIGQLRRGYQLQNRNQRGIRNNNFALELRFLKNAAFPFVIFYILISKLVIIEYDLLWIALFSLLFSVVMFFSSRMLHGNKNERSMSSFDSIAVGFAGALSAFCGISRIGIMLAVMTFRGVDRRKAVNWALLLSMPSLITVAFVDVLTLLTDAGRGLVSGSAIGYILSAVSAYIAGYVGIVLMRSMTAQNDNSGAAYYTFGVSLFSLFLYLSVV